MFALPNLVTMTLLVSASACGGRTLVADSLGADGTGGEATGDSATAGGDDDDDASTDTSGGDGDICGAVDLTVPLIPSHVVLVYDKTASMFSQPVPDGQGGTTTPWAALYAATEELLTRYPQPIASFGAELFPAPDTQATLSSQVCRVSNPIDVPVSYGSEGLLDGIPGPDPGPQSGATAGGRALRIAYAHLAELQETEPGVDAHVIYVTDGAPGCQPAQVQALNDCNGEISCVQARFPGLLEIFDGSIVNAIANANESRITTYVVGINIPAFDPLSNIACSDDADCPAGTQCCAAATGGTNCPIDGTCALPNFTVKNVNPRGALAAMGQAGGHPSPPPGEFYAVGGAPGISAALRDIKDALPTCRVRLDPPPDSDEELALTLGGVTYGFCVDELGEPTDGCPPLLEGPEACDSVDGVYYDADTETALLCGEACETFKQQGALDATYYCVRPDDDAP